jgi:hypothetical protein
MWFSPVSCLTGLFVELKYFHPITNRFKSMTTLHFKPVSHSWVAMHPEPKGVVQFLGGAFFGTFAPMLFYNHLLQYLYDKSYTVIILPFNFTFNHYRESFSLMREQYALLPELVRMAMAQGVDPAIYLDSEKYIWMGHSIGCKYITLLESANNLPEDKAALTKFIANVLDVNYNRNNSKACPNIYNKKTVQSVVEQLQALREELRSFADASKQLVRQCIGENKAMLDGQTENTNIYKYLFIKGQRSVFLAPVLSDTSSAIKPKPLADWIDSLGWGVQPNSCATKNLIEESGLFNRFVLAKFKVDSIACQTIDWFFNNLAKPPQDLRLDLGGGHFRPLGFSFADLVVNPWFDKPLLTTAARRNDQLEKPVDQQIPAIDH